MLKDINLFMNAKLEQGVIIKFLRGEDIDPVEIHHRLLCAFQEDAYELSSVYEWIRAFKPERTNLLDDHRAGRPRLDHIDPQILSPFHENEFHSVQNACEFVLCDVNRLCTTDLQKKRSMYKM
jgi:hypothetical protein